MEIKPTTVKIPDDLKKKLVIGAKKKPEATVSSEIRDAIREKYETK